MPGKKTLLSLLCLLSLSFGGIVHAEEPGPGAEGIGDNYFPMAGNGGYDTLHYTLDIAVDMETNTLDGTVTIEAEAVQASSQFNLDFNGFTISDLTVND